ncbi:MAG: 7,8-didemethyl-8-hydroxy-5-deazariboflavin synthase subunit CofG [Verrucomicrobiota bacterium]
MPPRAVTYSPSLTVPLTHDCPWHCRYCGYRSDAQGLLPDAEFHRLLETATRRGATEILVLAGEIPDILPHLRSEVRRRGFASFIDYVRWACERILERGLLPHTNIGAMSRAQFDRLARVNASMGVMLENIDDAFNQTVAPEKSATGRLKTIAAAGEARVPYTSGILIGLGESRESRLRSLDALAELHAKHGHLQEILLQNFVPNQGSALREAPQVPGLDEYLELIGHWRRVAPGVPIQIPPNLNPHWRELLPHVDDLGGVSAEGDLVNPDHPWDPPAVYAEACAAHGLVLRHRWAVHDAFVKRGWVSERVRQVIDDRTRDRPEEAS